jgi:hypothetical protein
MKLITIVLFAATVAFAQTAESRMPNNRLSITRKEHVIVEQQEVGSSPLCSLRNAWLVL